MYIGKKHEKFVSEIEKECSNVKVIKSFKLEELDTYKTLTKNKCSLPDQRNGSKDTFNYMIMINSKIELVKDAIERNTYGTKYFSWIDFGIFHVFKQVEKMSKFLKSLRNVELQGEFITFPGCWAKGYNIQSVHKSVNWRFCGGFFLGDKKNMLHFNEMTKTHLSNFMKPEKLLWEVNFWTWLEYYTEWEPDVYLADHNESILFFPRKYLKLF